MKILFICHANLCRSLIAQELTKKWLPQAEVFSRGLYADPQLQIPEKIIRFLTECEITSFAHTPTPLTPDDLKKADLIFCMEPEHLEKLVDRYAQYTNKIWLLNDFAFGKKTAVEDPIDLTGRSFKKQANLLKKTVWQTVQRIQKEFLKSL